MSGEALEFTVTRTRADYFEALLANLLRSWPTLAITPLVVVVALLVPPLLDGAALSPELLMIQAAVFVGFTALYCLMLPLFVWLSAGRSWKQPGAGEPLSVRLTRATIDMEHVTGSSSTAWNVWKAWFETKRHIIIRHQLGFIQFFPKRALAPDLLPRLRALLSEALPKTRRA